VKPELKEIPLTERKVMRRGLMAGLFGFGAAAILKVTGKAEPAEAANLALVYPGAAADPAVTNTSFHSTILASATGYANFSGRVFSINAASGPVVTFRDAIAGTAGGTDGYGLSGFGSGTGAGTGGTGGNALTAGGAAGPGVRAQGGFSQSGIAGHGVEAVAGATNTGTSGNGVVATASQGKGVLGQSVNGDGVHGTSTNGVGLRGTSPNFVGLVGISDNSIGLYGYNVTPNVPAFYAENLGPSGRLAGLFNGDVRIMGTLSATAKNAVVTMADGSEALLYCQESPEPYFEDFGRARLVNGVAQVQLEPEFASLVRRDYMVFPVPEGDTKGLFISQKNANGFEVREAQGGTSNVPFTYRVVAKRKDIEGKRLERLDPKVKAHIGKMRAEAAAKNHPAAKAPAGGNPLVPLEPIPPLPEPIAPRSQR
jgi:hypothetical protein